jgi:hypothetical protein
MPLSAGEGPRLSSGSAALPGSSTFNNCSVAPAAANASAFMIHESDMTSTTWNNSSFIHNNKAPNASQTQWGNTANLVRIKTTFNNCTFDWSNCQEPFMRGWIGSGHHLRFNSPTFVGATSDTMYNNQAFINFQEDKTMTVEIYGTPTNKVDLRGIRNGVNKQTLIRNQNSTITLVDCIYDDKIDINGARRGYPYWNANFNLDRCLAQGELGRSDQAMPKIQVAVNATNTIFQMGQYTTTSLVLVSGDSTSTANLTHCTFFSNNELTTAPSFLLADKGTSMTMNYSIVKGSKPTNNQGYLSGAYNILAYGTQVNGTNLLTNTSNAGPYLDNTGHIGAGSPAISNAIFSPLKIDYDGDVRPAGTGSYFPDIGADETSLVPVEMSTFKVE